MKFCNVTKKYKICNVFSELQIIKSEKHLNNSFLKVRIEADYLQRIIML